MKICEISSKGKFYFREKLEGVKNQESLVQIRPVSWVCYNVMSAMGNIAIDRNQLQLYLCSKWRIVCRVMTVNEI